MAKMSKSQYELLTEACGDGLADVMARDSKHLEDAAWTIIDRIAGTLKLDNENFNIKQFKDGVEAHAKLTVLTRKGINLG